MASGNISADGKSILYTTPDKTWWVAPLDRQTPPRRLPMEQPVLAVGASGRVYFTQQEGASEFPYSMQLDGADRHPVFSEAIRPQLQRIPTRMVSISPDERWVLVSGSGSQIAAAPVGGGDHIQMVCWRCRFRWSHDGKVAWFTFPVTEGGSGTSVAVPLPAGQMLPPLPAVGFQGAAEVAKLPGAITIPFENIDIGAGMSYAYTKVVDTRNIFQIPLE